MTIGQPPGGGVPFGITTVNGNLRRVDHDRRAAAVAREALVGGLAGDGARDEAGRKRQIAERLVPVGIVRLEARAAVVAGRDRLHVVVRIVATEERRELRVGVEDQLGPAREVGARDREARAAPSRGS